ALFQRACRGAGGIHHGVRFVFVRRAGGRNESIEASVKSWIESANEPGNDFPIENLPFGVFQDGICVAIGDVVLSLGLCAQAGFLNGLSHATLEALTKGRLNELMALSATERSALRERLTELLMAGQKDREGISLCLSPLKDAVLRKPVDVGDYTDFYASV